MFNIYGKRNKNVKVFSLTSVYAFGFNGIRCINDEYKYFDWIYEFINLGNDFNVDPKIIKNIIKVVADSKKEADTNIQLYERARNMLLDVLTL